MGLDLGTLVSQNYLVRAELKVLKMSKTHHYHLRSGMGLDLETLVSQNYKYLMSRDHGMVWGDYKEHAIQNVVKQIGRQHTCFCTELSLINGVELDDWFITPKGLKIVKINMF